MALDQHGGYIAQEPYVQLTTIPNRPWQTVAGAAIRVLVVEDVERLAGLILDGLAKAGFQAETAHTAGDARERLLDGAFDALILDLGLPDQDGLSFLMELREAGIMLPVIILTTRIMVHDRIAGLNAGADDYLTKPFDFDELVARLRAVLRRPATSVSDVLRVANLTLDSLTREVRVDDTAVTLAPKEQLLLEHLMRRPDAVVSKLFLEDNIYGTSGDSAANSLEVLIHRLRARLRELGARVLVHTVRGVGYMITELVEEAG